MRAQPMQALKHLVMCASLLVCLLEGGHLFAAPHPLPGEQVGPGYDIEMSRMIPMRGGVELEAWIFKPSHLKTKARIATIKIFHDGERRSILTIPLAASQH